MQKKCKKLKQALTSSEEVHKNYQKRLKSYESSKPPPELSGHSNQKSTLLTFSPPSWI
jgi:hypothetical protein